MMLQMSKEEIELYDKLEKATDRGEIDKINQEIRKIALKRQEELKDCPFAH